MRERNVKGDSELLSTEAAEGRWNFETKDETYKSIQNIT